MTPFTLSQIELDHLLLTDRVTLLRPCEAPAGAVMAVLHRDSNSWAWYSSDEFSCEECRLGEFFDSPYGRYGTRISIPYGTGHLTAMIHEIWPMIYNGRGVWEITLYLLDAPGTLEKT